MRPRDPLWIPRCGSACASAFPLEIAESTLRDPTVDCGIAELPSDEWARIQRHGAAAGVSYLRSFPFPIDTRVIRSVLAVDRAGEQRMQTDQEAGVSNC
jgi:hypothetical protein